MTELQPGVVIQIGPEVARFEGCFAVVDEVRSWGVTATVRVPCDPESGESPIRLETGKFEIVGGAIWIQPFEPEPGDTGWRLVGP